MQLHSQQNTFIQIKTNQSYQHWEPVGVGAFQGCQSYPEASGGVEGYGLQKKIHHRWVSLCADMKRIQEQQK